MSDRREAERRRRLRRRALPALLLLLALPVACVAALLHAPAGTAQGPLVAQPDSAVPSGTFVGAAGGEVWMATLDDVVRRTADGAWQPLPRPTAPDGRRVRYLRDAGRFATVSARGGLALAAILDDREQALVVRDPDGGLSVVPAPAVAGSATLAPGDVLRQGESLFGRALLTAVDEPSGRTGAFVVPAPRLNAVVDGIAHFDGVRWTREAICLDAACTPAPSAFSVLAIAALDPDRAWLLVRTGVAADGVVLLRRDASAPEVRWTRSSLGRSPFAARSPPVSPAATVTIAPRAAGDPLVVTEQGLWVDATVTVGTAAPLDATLFYVPDGRGGGQVTGSWCDTPSNVPLCSDPLGAELAPGEGRSYAWGGGGPFGTRVVTGLAGGALLTLQDRAFVRVPTLGDGVEPHFGAAFSAPDEGWLAPNVHVTRNPEPNRLQSWPVPFRRPLTAIAAAPGSEPGALGSAALAVGDNGQVARYVPGAGWRPEFLLSDGGARATPRLRAVAWPEPGRAYAVGDNAEMWLWRAETGLWEPDPAKSPNLVLVNFMGIAFDPANAERGYAVGKQGLLLRYGRTWTQEPLPEGIDQQTSFTSIAFAGSQALVAYRRPTTNGGAVISTGGLLVDDGGGWRRDETLAAALPAGPAGVPTRVAGLPDGGAVVASAAGYVAVRDSAGGPWRAVPDSGGGRGFPAAVAAIREHGEVRAVLSAATDYSIAADWELVFEQPPPDQAPVAAQPDALPLGGSVIRQTDHGWRDERHRDFPVPDVPQGAGASDRPVRPDGVLALLLDADGTQGWAVGGETGQDATFRGSAIQTAGIMRYPAEGTAPLGASTAPVVADPGAATFAIGGNAACVAACADFANVSVGPDVWLSQAVERAAGIAGVRAFLHTGPGVAAGIASRLPPRGFAREQANYAARLVGKAGALPVFAAPSASDVDGAGTLDAFASAFGGFGAPLGGAAPGAGIAPVSPLTPGRASYSFDSSGGEGTVRVIVLDTSAPAVGVEQTCWLAQQLADAGAQQTPAIVVGNRDMSPQQGAGNAPSDAAVVAATLVLGTPPDGCTLTAPPAGASAYFFDYPEQNRTYVLTAAGRSIPTFGSGTLGYVSSPDFRTTDQAVSAAGFMLAAVDVARRDPDTNVAPVRVRLIAAIGDLALDALDGTLLRRSRVALFRALARRPEAGVRCSGGGPGGSSCDLLDPDPYVPIPGECKGGRCASALLPEYSFVSSDPDIADFVRQDPATTNPRSPLLGDDGKPIADAASGLLCAFNAGRTTITVTSGGLSYSTVLTVQAGSVQRPCGTVPLRNPPGDGEVEQQVPPSPLPATDPGFSGTPVQLPPPPAPAPAPAPTPTPLQVSPPLPLGVAQLPPLMLPPALPAAQPIPPSGTAPVSQPVSQPAMAPERQEEEEHAIDMVQSMVVYDPDHAMVVPRYLPLLVVLLALGGGTAYGARRRPAFAEVRDEAGGGRR